jgi:hypothetical protein
LAVAIWTFVVAIATFLLVRMQTPIAPNVS